MKQIMLAVLVCLSGCTKPDKPEHPTPCWFEWMGPGVETNCDSSLQISRNHVVLWASTDDGHHVLAVFEGWFPEDLSQPISTLDAHVAVELPLSGGWCDSTVDGENPPQGEMIVEFSQEGDRAQVDLEGYVSCDGVGWRYLRVVVDAEVVRMAGAEP